MTTDTKNKTILVVDDEDSLRSSLQRDITRAGYNVLIAENGKQAGTMHENHHIDLTVTDLLMPEKDGIELIMELREKYPDPLIIAITGGAAGKIAATHILPSASALGAQRTLQKPFSIKKLIDIIEELLAGS